ncbi:hypothetical protein [Escherichia coli]|uniref:hypothetical protein n=1 Tax=Escherichia coli TaxID=562 RepID=UPI000ACCB8FB|nr:hypothetical protein [Escherichia coli]
MVLSLFFSGRGWPVAGGLATSVGFCGAGLCGFVCFVFCVSAELFLASCYLSVLLFVGVLVLAFGARGRVCVAEFCFLAFLAFLFMVVGVCVPGLFFAV